MHLDVQPGDSFFQYTTVSRIFLVTGDHTNNLTDADWVDHVEKCTLQHRIWWSINPV